MTTKPKPKSPMTLAQFVARFARKVKREKTEWILSHTGCLRGGGGHCPISFTANRATLTTERDNGLPLLGLTGYRSREIIKAADCMTGHSPRLRAQLLKAAGL